jgi:hypothetical protein
MSSLEARPEDLRLSISSPLEWARDAVARIDKIGDPSATAEERQDRKRRLIKGPREFREMRGIDPKPKD